MSFDWQPVWLNLQYQKTSPSVRLNHEYVSMLFHIHSPWSYACLGSCHERLTHTARLVGYLKSLANYTAFCLSLQKAQCCLVGVWPDVFPVVLYCREWWRELCPMVVVLARAPLTRWLRRWNMLIKLKTTSKNLHQIVTLVVNRATVSFIYGETCTCRHTFLSVYLCGCQTISLCCVCSLNLCHAASIMMLVFLSDCLTRAVISAHLCLWINFSFDMNHLYMNYLSDSMCPANRWKKKDLFWMF